MIGPGLGHALTGWLLRNSAGAAVVALLVLLVQWMLGRRISARWRHNLWLLVIVRLVLPPLPAVRLPAIPHLALMRPVVSRLRQVVENSREVVRPAAKPAIHARAMILARDEGEALAPIQGRLPMEMTAEHSRSVGPLRADEHLSSVNFREGLAPGSEPAVLTSPEWAKTPIVVRVRPVRVRIAVPSQLQPLRPRPISWAWILGATWGAVALALLLKTVIGSIRIHRTVRRLRPVRDPGLLELLQDCCRLLELSKAPALLEGPSESGPALVGFARPKLLLPACVTAHFTWREVRHVMLHELIHLKRRDILVNYLTSIAQAVHWFNPLVWLAAARMRADRELACDEAVLAVTPWREGRAYGSTIVKLLELLARGAVPAGAMGVIQHKALMHRRIAMIARFDGSRRHWSGSAVLLSVVVAGAALAGAVRAQVQPARNPEPAVTSSSDSDVVVRSNVTVTQTTSVDAPPTEVKSETPGEEANAQRAVQAEATNDEEPIAAAEKPELGNLSVEAAEPGQPEVAPDPPVDVQPPPAANSPVAGAASPSPRAGIGVGGGGRSGPDMQHSPRAGGSFGGGGFARGGFGPGGSMVGGRGGFGGAVMSGGPVPEDQPQFATIEDAAAAKADAKTLEKLQRPMPMQVENEPLVDVLNMLAEKGGFDVLIDNRALAEAGIDQNSPVQINIREPQPVEQLLHFVLRQTGGDEVGFSLVHGVVLVSNRAELASHLVTRVYDVSDLGSADEVQQAIYQTIGNGVNVRFLKGKLIVTTSEPKQREVAKLLTLLRSDGPQRPGGVGLAPTQPRELKAYQLQHASASDAAKTVQSALGDKLQIDAASDNRNNTLILTGPADSLHAADDLVHKLDANSPSAPDPGPEPLPPPAAR